MNKKITFYIFSIFLFFVFLINNLAQAQIQTCKITSVSWSKTTTVLIGEPVDMIVRGQDCNGQKVLLNIWEDDGLVGDDSLGTSEATFINNAVTNKIRFTQASYDLAKDFGDGSSEEIYFVAVVGSGLNQNSLTSNNLTLKNKQIGGGGGGPGDGGGQPGEDVSVDFNIPNPIAAESLVDLAKAIGRFLFQIAIPIAVIIIIYAGLLFLTSGGNKEKITKARTALWYAVVGLAIILIGQGFFTLIKSILDLGGPSP